MKTTPVLMLTLTLLLPWAQAEEKYFRVCAPSNGPLATIAALTADGFIAWTNTPATLTFTVQTTSSLRSPVNWVDYIQIPATNGTTRHRIFDLNPPAGMAFIPAGTFTMGNTFTNESVGNEFPIHTVYVSEFYMDKFEVTYALWTNVVAWATSTNRPIELRYQFDRPGFGKAANHPVVDVSWYDCVTWCNARSEMEGLTPCYYADAGQSNVYRSGQINLANACVNWNANGYRLPTEAEWEYAARAGLSGQRFPLGNTIAHTNANYYSRTNEVYDISETRGFHPDFYYGYGIYTSPVGYFAPNGYGFYDMAGNAWEWVWDRFATRYPDGYQINPRGDPTGFLRVFRGGAWHEISWKCRVSARGSAYPYDWLNIGFRTVVSTK